MLQAIDLSRSVRFPAMRPQAAIAAVTAAAPYGRDPPRHDLTQKSSPRPAAAALSFIGHLRQVSAEARS